MDNFDVYEKHFTTMNYRKDVTFRQVFIYLFNNFTFILVLLASEKPRNENGIYICYYNHR